MCLCGSINIVWIYKNITDSGFAKIRSNPIIITCLNKNQNFIVTTFIILNE